MAPGLEGTLGFPEGTTDPSNLCQQEVNFHSSITMMCTSKTTASFHFFEKHFKLYGMLVIKKFTQVMKKINH